MYLGYIHSFRALAITFIVAGHCIDAFQWSNNDLERALRIVASNGSTLFVFIAGYLFQHLLPKYQIKKYFVSKSTNVLLPYFLISIPAIFVFTVIQQRENLDPGFYDNPLWLQTISFYYTGAHLAPFWFVPMITIFFLISPVLRWLDNFKAFYLLLPLLIILSCFIDRGLPNQSFLHFFSAYVLGMWCCKYKETLNPVFRKPVIAAGFAIVALLLIVIEHQLSSGTMTYMNYLQKLALSLLFLGLFIRFQGNAESAFVNTVANVSFGIFFLHSYVITSGKLIYTYINGALPTGSVLIYLLFAVCTLLISTALIVGMQKAFGKRSRMLVGS